MQTKRIKNLVLTAMLMAVGMILPLYTGSIPEIGNMLLPMHFPVLLCGLICGWPWGLACGCILPILRSLAFGMPPVYPKAVVYFFELGTYGLVSGLIYRKKKNTGTLFLALIAAMLAGRIVYGLAYTIILGVSGKAFTWGAFTAGAFTEALPGIIAQIVLIPVIVKLKENFTKGETENASDKKCQ